MARPVTGSIKQTGPGKWKAYLSCVVTGKGRTYTFDSEAQARRWLDDALVAREAGQELPNPEPYRRPSPPPRSAQRRDSGRPLAVVARQWHFETYEANEVAGVDRSQDVLRHIDQYVVRYFHGMGITDVTDVTRPACIDFARWLVDLPPKHPDGEHVPRPPELASSQPKLAKGTSHSVLQVLRRVLDRAVEDRLLLRNPADSVRALAGPHEPTAQERHEQETDRYLDLATAAGVAAWLSVPHQINFWLERLQGVRLAEGFGLRVRHLFEMDGILMLDLTEQAGQGGYQVRDGSGQYLRVESKDELKQVWSRRKLVVPSILTDPLRWYVDAYHRDPETGQVDADDWLIYGIQDPGPGKAGTYRTALDKALAACGLSDRGITPQTLRQSLATDLVLLGVEELKRRRFLGHAPLGNDVLASNYLLPAKERELHRDAAEAIDQYARDEIGGVIVPTSKRHEWGRCHPIRERLDYVEEVLELHGWRPESSMEANRWCTVAEVADMIGLVESNTRRKMAGGDIPAERRVVDGRKQWCARRDAAEAYVQQQEQQLTLNDVADELGLSYHEAYRMLHDLELDVETRLANGELDITEVHAKALRVEQERVQALYARSMKLSEAAEKLSKSERTMREWAKNGKLDVDDETDSSRATFVTRSSVRRHKEDPPTIGPGSETVTFEQLAGLSTLSESKLRDLVRAGLLTTVKRGRGCAVTTDSIREWAIGYRPDLLDRLP